MKKWILIIALFLMTLIIWQFSLFYQSIQETKLVTQDEALAIMNEKLNISEVDDVDFYHGTEAYQIIHAKNDHGEEIIVWVSEDGEQIIKKKVEDGLRIEEVEQFIQDELSPQKIISIRLGMENHLPVYEIVYIHEDGRYSFHYVTFEDGSFVKRYHLQNA
ncbi:DUF5590 domain-containing protein [Anaerobacillus sp. MEB173]|uniref:cell wall elongation regulator TseB-like domain-containing protein n=1 Tax=Anaerobacillus sp. MEB173 TaxID=3383345 RepID=UPI003F8F71C2